MKPQLLLTLFAVSFCRILPAGERTQNFDTDPGWDGMNNRPVGEPREVEQDFGYSATRYSVRDAAAPAGEIGGLVTPAAEPAWYATPVGPFTFRSRFSASGTMVVPVGAGNTLVGFFNPATAKEWRTANSLVWRINGRGETLHAHFEYMTRLWRAGAGIIGRYDKETDRMHPVELPTGDTIYPWSLEYDPTGENGGGVIRARLGELESTCPVTAELKADGAEFTHFGILNVIKSVDGGGRIFIGELSINGNKVDLSQNPKWESHDNRRRYKTTHVRPWFDIGWSGTQNSRGEKAGEIGGYFYRGDCRDASRLGYYGDRLETLTLDKPMQARGRISFHRGVSDSTTLFGFFHHEKSVRVNDSQKDGTPENFLGFSLEGPSSEGFYIYGVCRGAGGDTAAGFDRACPRIYPDGASHEWALEYDPKGAGGRGSLMVSLDGVKRMMKLGDGMKKLGTEFDRFGFVTPWIDGNGQTIYLDDLTYTSRQED